GLNVVILDRQTFPRDKVCGGWITPPVVEELEIDLEEYSGGHVLQNIHGFRTSRMGSREVETDYGRPISYGIRRCEFDDFLLKRCRARVHQGVPLTRLEQSGHRWIVNGQFKTQLVIGLGRFDPHALPNHLAAFGTFLKKARKIAFDLPGKMVGHSYLLYGHAKRNVAGDGVLLIGDAAGLAYSQSGEGIRPAIESGLLAAKAILAVAGANSPTLSETYRCLLAQRFGKVQEEWAFNIGRHIPTWLVSSLSRILLANQWFSRRVILDRWFLHCDEPAMVC